MPQAATRTSTSCGPIAGRGASVSSSLRSSVRRRACMGRKTRRQGEGEKRRISGNLGLVNLLVSPSPCLVLVADSFRIRSNSQQVMVRCDEQRRAIFAEFAVGSAVTGVQQTKLLALRCEDRDAAGNGREHVAVPINGEAVARTGTRRLLCF